LANLVWASLPSRCTPHRRNTRRSARFFGEWNGSDAASSASVNGLLVGKHWMNAAEPVEDKPYLRLEHELQTAMRRQRWAPPQFRSALTIRRDTVPAALRC